MEHQNLWQGLRTETLQHLGVRNYSPSTLEERLAGDGLEAGVVLANREAFEGAGAWIPGVEVLPRQIYPQRHRGWFSEFGREGQGKLGELGIWPQQWSVAKMFAGTAKGFHIHPPHIPEDQAAGEWFQKLFGNGSSLTDRPYDREQWDVMYFVQGRVDFLLCDERAGLPRRSMRIFIESDDRRGPNNATLVIPPGVAHALRVEGTEDLLMVYGTSTTFKAEFEGRIASDVEVLPLPPEWAGYLGERR